MSISRCRHFINAVTKEAITELVDSFGSKMIIQTPILTGDHAVDVAQATVLLQSNEAQFIANLKASHGYTDADIAKLQKTPSDCGCSGGAS